MIASKKEMTIRMIKFLLTASLLLAASQAQNSPLADNPTYRQDCAKCHGKSAEGRFMAGPSLVSEKTTSLPVEQLRTVITNGRHRMPKFADKLTPQEIDTLVNQIKQVKKQ